MPPFTQLKLFNHGLKSMKVNFSIFSGQRNKPDLKIIEPFWSVWRQEEQIPISCISKAIWCSSRRMV
jgi:hypothetical protein